MPSKEMNLPNYFLADLPPEATLSPAMLAEACQTLKRNRERYLSGRSTEQLVKVLSGVADAWLKPDHPFRKLVLERGPVETGFSHKTLQRGLDDFFRQVTPENLHALLVQEFGNARRLDAVTATEVEQKSSRAAMAVGPEFLVHVAAGNIPNPAWMSIILGLLARSAQFVKCASGSAFLPRLFAHSLYEADPKLGACLEIAEWRGGNADLENILFAEASCVTATGSDETLAAIRSRLPAHVRFLGYGQRVSFGFVAREVLSRLNAPRIAARVADDVVAWNQLGCLSPHVIYLQPGGEMSPEKFAGLLADELERREQTEPRGELPAPHAAGIASRRGIYKVRAAHSPETLMWHSQESTAWTVVFEADARFQISCLNRFIYVKPVKDLVEMLQHAEVVRGKVSTVGIAASEHQIEELATQLARWGVTRVCPLGRMQNPPLTWRHDGRPALGDLVTWADLEM
ncbi:MAG TPA: acyl-CoA reductase [Verrucomicrobiae bacterium]|nr:acyl-CoA reductase [Verrucomicrobiae bacterium]